MTERPFPVSTLTLVQIVVAALLLVLAILQWTR
jgi:hypothetical protein